MSAHTLDEESGSVEERVERVLRWGSGHVLVTGKDIESVTRIVEMALANVTYFRLARVSAICEDPQHAMAKVLTAGGDVIMDSGFVELRNQMTKLLDEAVRAGQCIFVIVEDADQATVEQFERLRTTLDVGPEAIERLRLVIVGTKKALRTLDDHGARGLASRIGARLDATGTTRRRRKRDAGPARVQPEPSRFRSFVMTAASGTLMATVAISLLVPHLAPTVTDDLLANLEGQVGDLAIRLDAVGDDAGALLSDEAKERLASAASMSLKFVHGKGVAHAVDGEFEAGNDAPAGTQEKSPPRVVASAPKKVVAVARPSAVASATAVAAPAAKPVAKPIAKPVAKPVAKPIAKPIAKQAPVAASRHKSAPVRVAANAAPSKAPSSPVKRMPPTFAAPVAPGIEVASKPTTRTAPPVSKWTPKPGPDGFVLQVASFSAMGNARALKDKLSERIERVFIQKFEIDGRTLFRVRVGGFATIEQSVEPKQVLVDAGYKPLYVR
jgi:hypothetical protein